MRAVVWLSLLVGLAACPLLAAQAGPRLAVPATGAYNGAYVEFGEGEDQVTLERIDDFAAMVGKRQALIAFANDWARQRFPSEQVRIIQGARAVPLILWYPHNSETNKTDAEFKLEDIIAGRWDAYLDAWGQAARTAGGPLLVSWALEMNGDWYPWSGVRHGGGEPVPGGGPPLAKGPETYQQAYRHVVERVRAAGADNVEWVFHVNNGSWPRAPWNRMAAYYPGSAWVDWLGMSAYGKQFPDPHWVSVRHAILDPYAELAALDPDKPILLAEWGIGEFPRQGSKADWIREAMAAMTRLPRLKGALYWHERWQNADLHYSNLRVHSSLESLTAFREAIAQPFWLDQPQILGAQPPQKVTANP